MSEFPALKIGKDDIASKSDRVAGESVEGTKRWQLTWGGGGEVTGVLGLVYSRLQKIDQNLNMEGGGKCACHMHNCLYF